MPFVVKVPSKVARVMNIEACPPHDETHETNDFPIFYDPCYYPELYPQIFETIDGVSIWLQQALRGHLVLCADCSGKLGSIRVLNNGQRIQLFLGIMHLDVTSDEIGASLFSFCRLVRSLTSGIRSMDVDTVKIMGCNPLWMSYSSSYHIENLNVLNVSQLQIAAKTVVNPIPRRKESLANCLLNDYKQFFSKFSIPTDNDLDFCSVPSRCSARPVILADLCEMRYGVTAAATLCCGLRTDGFVYEKIQLPLTMKVLNWLTLDKKVLIKLVSKTPKKHLLSVLHSIPARVRPPYKCTIISCATVIINLIIGRCTYLIRLPSKTFVHEFVSLLPRHVQLPFLENRGEQIMEILQNEFSIPVIDAILTTPYSQSHAQKEKRIIVRTEKKEEERLSVQTSIENWPQKISEDVVLECLNNYRRGVEWKRPKVCCVCSLERQEVENITIKRSGTLPFSFDLLRVFPSTTSANVMLKDMDERLNNVVLEIKGLGDITPDINVLQLCSSCRRSLEKNHLPKFALANNLYRGRLPDFLCDISWVEEMVCAKYRNTAHITRLYQSDDSSQLKVFHGNTCAHEMNVVSTAQVLPRTPADVNDLISVVFIGPGQFKPDYLGATFRVRKAKIVAFLIFLKQNNCLYRDMEIDVSLLDLYPEDGVLPQVETCTIHDPSQNGKKIFAEETAGFTEHPASYISSSSHSEKIMTLLEKTSVSDPEGIKITGRACTAGALRKLLPRDENNPDLIIHRSIYPVPEYQNPDLIAGMFPTLFPLGTGSFEDPARSVKISFEAQANYFLDLYDHSFRYHHSFIFIVLNIIQRRKGHLQTYFTVRKNRFDDIANKLISVSAGTLQSLADRLEHEGQLESLNEEEKHAMLLLNKVNTISARIPGSQASKINIRNEIRSYFTEFGLPHIFFTFNPSVIHSPIFQAMYGDETIDLTERYPSLVSASERAKQLAQDPVAAADFFEFLIRCLFENMFGWDYKKRRSTSKGGILGPLESFYGTSEFTERGCLHAHFLIWLVGGLNPSDIHEKLKQDINFERRLFSYFEDIISHHFPDVDITFDNKYEPRKECPPQPPPFPLEKKNSMSNVWKSFMDTEVKILGEHLQRHKCRDVCHKYGNTDTCRFQFPHKVEPISFFELSSNSVVLKCLDPMVNYFNRYLLVFCRHNHDIKSILSGKAAKAAMFYITDYITKMDVKTYQVLTLLSRAVGQLPFQENSSSSEQAKKLLHKCLAQFTKQQQIHAQQAAHYLRGFRDGIKSHNTIPMMSNLLLEYLTLNNVSCNDDFEFEPARLSIHTDQEGRLLTGNQVLDYLHRSKSLASMNFYDFCCCITLEKKKMKGKSQMTTVSLNLVLFPDLI